MSFTDGNARKTRPLGAPTPALSDFVPATPDEVMA